MAVAIQFTWECIDCVSDLQVEQHYRGIAVHKQHPRGLFSISIHRRDIR